MTFHRPRAPKTDKNHAQVIADFSRMVGGWAQLSDGEGVKYKAWSFTMRGISGVLVDTSSYGGLALDLRLYIGGATADIEIKTEQAYYKTDHDMTPGEALYFDVLGTAYGRIIYNAEMLYYLADGLVGEC